MQNEHNTRTGAPYNPSLWAKAYEHGTNFAVFAALAYYAYDWSVTPINGNYIYAAYSLVPVIATLGVLLSSIVEKPTSKIRLLYVAGAWMFGFLV